jgi:hypothetical protein
MPLSATLLSVSVIEAEKYAVVWQDGKPVMTGDDAPEKGA